MQQGIGVATRTVGEDTMGCYLPSNLLRALR